MKPSVAHRLMMAALGVAWCVFLPSPLSGLAAAAGQSGSSWGGNGTGLQAQSSALQEAAARTSPGRGWAGVQAPAGSKQQSTSSNPISESLKSAGKKLESLFTPKRSEESIGNDPTSLSGEARPSAQLYMALARLAEQNHRWQEAEAHYQRVLQLAPNHPDALLGLARLKDGQRKWPEADQFYQQAVRAHPQHAAVYNDYGLSLARRGQLPQAASLLERAVKLEPGRWLYRNNIALVLVQLGETDAALRHLLAVQPEAVAYYNLGYMLQRRGDRQSAAAMFAKSLEKDPTLTPARARLDQLREEQQLAATAPASQAVSGPAPLPPSVPEAGPGVAVPPGPIQKPNIGSGTLTDALAPSTAGVAAPLPPVRQNDPSWGATNAPGNQPAPSVSSLGPASSQPPISQTAPLPPPIRSAARPWNDPALSAQPRHVQPLPPVGSAWRR